MDLTGARADQLVTVKGVQYLRRLTRSADVREAIKQVVSMQECGALDPKHFNTRSHRSTLATVSEKVGISRERMLQLGIWAPDSTVADEFYRYSNQNTGLLAALHEDSMDQGFHPASALKHDMDTRSRLIGNLTMVTGSK